MGSGSSRAFVVVNERNNNNNKMADARGSRSKRKESVRVRRSSTTRKRNKVHVSTDSLEAGVISDVTPVSQTSDVTPTSRNSGVTPASRSKRQEIQKYDVQQTVTKPVPPSNRPKTLQLITNGSLPHPPIPKPRTTVPRDVINTRMRRVSSKPIPMPRSGQARVTAVARRSQLDRDRKLNADDTSAFHDLDLVKVASRSRSDSWDLERYEVFLRKKRNRIRSIETETSYDDASNVGDVTDASCMSRTNPDSLQNEVGFHLRCVAFMHLLFSSCLS